MTYFNEVHDQGFTPNGGHKVGRSRDKWQYMLPEYKASAMPAPIQNYLSEQTGAVSRQHCHRNTSYSISGSVKVLQRPRN
jgi:hypothetical protein